MRGNGLLNFVPERSTCVHKTLVTPGRRERGREPVGIIGRGERQERGGDENRIGRRIDAKDTRERCKDS